eukprot:m51a1_g3734 hypothetical protein (362) ;mRNA; r:35048-36315
MATQESSDRVSFRGPADIETGDAKADTDDKDSKDRGSPAIAAASLAGRLAQSGPFWLGMWFVLNIGLTLANKALFQFGTFTFPTVVSLCHMSCSAICAHAVIERFQVPVRKLATRAEWVRIVLFSLLFCSNILTGNIGLRFVPVSLVQCVRSTIPGITMALSIAILGKRYTTSHVMAVVLVVIGVATATYTTLDFHVVGFMFTVAVCFLSSLKSVFTSRFLVGAGLRFHPFDLLRTMASLSVIHLSVVCLVTGEAASAIEWFRTSEQATLKFVGLLLLNGLAAFFLNVCNFFFTKLTSALTVTIVGNVKHVATIGLSIIMFKNPVTFYNAIGILTTIAGAACYSVVEYQDAVSKGRKPSAM